MGGTCRSSCSRCYHVKSAPLAVAVRERARGDKALLRSSPAELLTAELPIRRAAWVRQIAAIIVIQTRKRGLVPGATSHRPRARTMQRNEPLTVFCFGLSLGDRIDKICPLLQTEIGKSRKDHHIPMPSATKIPRCQCLQQQMWANANRR